MGKDRFTYFPVRWGHCSRNLKSGEHEEDEQEMESLMRQMGLMWLMWPTPHETGETDDKAIPPTYFVFRYLIS